MVTVLKILFFDDFKVLVQIKKPNDQVLACCDEQISFSMVAERVLKLIKKENTMVEFFWAKSALK
jgi:hypothetical protein